LDNWEIRPPVDTIRGQAFELDMSSGFFLGAFAWLAADPDHQLTTTPEQNGQCKIFKKEK